LALQQILFSIDLFLSYWTLIPRTLGPSNDFTAQRLDLFAWCVRLSRLLVGFQTHFKSLHFHFISPKGQRTCLYY